MMEDFKNYQSADTAWRYDAYLKETKKAIAKTEARLTKLKARLEKLEKNPPLYDTFNWSA